MLIQMVTHYVSWNFKAGGAAVSNTDGTTTSQVSANVDAGFSVVNWSGNSSATTIGHGLGPKKPNVIIFRNLEQQLQIGFVVSYEH